MIRVLYLRTMMSLNLKAGGSVSHTSGVINELHKLTDLFVISNDHLPGVVSDVRIRILKPLPVFSKFASELLQNVTFVVIAISKGPFDLLYQRHTEGGIQGVILSFLTKSKFVLEFMHLVVNDAKLARELGKNARALSEKHHSWLRHVQEILSFALRDGSAKFEWNNFS